MLVGIVGSGLLALQQQMSGGQEGFKDATDTHIELTEKTISGISTIYYIYIITQIFFLALTVWALYLAFKRNGGFELGSFLAAICCSVCYIVYAYAIPVQQQQQQQY